MTSGGSGTGTAGVNSKRWNSAHLTINQEAHYRHYRKRHERAERYGWHGAAGQRFTASEDDGRFVIAVEQWGLDVSSIEDAITGESDGPM